MSSLREELSRDLENLIFRGQEVLEALNSIYESAEKSRVGPEYEYESFLKALDDLRKGVSDLKARLENYRKIKLPITGVDLPNNDVYTMCLNLIARVEGLWYRGVVIVRTSRSKEIGNVIINHATKAVTTVSPWIGDCLRWVRRAIPPTRPLHDVLIEVEAAFADALLQVLMRDFS